MASIANDQDPEQQTNQATQPAAGAPVTVGGTAGASASGGQGATGAAAPAAGVSQVSSNANSSPQASNGYIDVGSYLDANQGGSQQLGQTVASNLTNDYNATTSGIDTSAQNAQSMADQGYTHENAGLIQQAASNPTGFSADPNNVGAFQAQLNDTYSGPTNWADLGNQQANVANAQTEGNLYQTPGGLNVLAQQQEGDQTSQGINQLDSLLLGAPGAYSTVQAASQPFNTLGTYLDNANTGVGNAITTGQNNAAQASADALNAFTGANGTLTNLNNTVNSTTAQDIAQAQAEQAALQSDIGGLYGGQAVDNTPTTLGTYGGGTTPWVNTTNYNVGQLSPQDLAGLGITQDQWNALQQAMQQAGTSTGFSGHNFGAMSGTSQIDLDQYLDQQNPNVAITNANSATPQQYAEMSAIQQLLGNQTPANLALDPTQAAQAGTYTGPNSLNTFDYNSALSGAQGTVAAQNAAAQQEATDIGAAGDLAHAQAEHNHGVLGAIENAVTHPLTTMATLGNPLDYAANTNRILKGQNQNPTDISAPNAKIVAPIVGGIIGGIYGNYGGATAGIAAGNALGGTLQNLGGNANKSYAFGGTVEDYLDAKEKNNG